MSAVGRTTPHRIARQERRVLAFVLLLLLGCLDGGGPMDPASHAAEAVTLQVTRSLITVGAVTPAALQLPSDVQLLPGSVTWTVTPATAGDVRRSAAREDSVDVIWKAAGAARGALRRARGELGRRRGRGEQRCGEWQPRNL
ncbi:MAG: hypothetical protein NTW72_04535 [Gemmatimonadetes bacterium]|nr:hypothetical protein [Gemmatimonadota bacterium]